MTEERKKAKKIATEKSGAFSLEAYKSGRELKILICGVVGINNFSAEEIHLKTQGGRISVFGNHLCLFVLENKTVEIRGGVLNVGFE